MFNSFLEAEENIKDFLPHKAAPQPVRFKLFWELDGDVSQCHRSHMLTVKLIKLKYQYHRFTYKTTSLTSSFL